MASVRLHRRWVFFGDCCTSRSLMALATASSFYSPWCFPCSSARLSSSLCPLKTQTESLRTAFNPQFCLSEFLSFGLLWQRCSSAPSSNDVLLHRLAALLAHESPF